MTIQKRILVADRVRQPPDAGFSWLDRRFLKEFAPRLSSEAIVLYLFLAAVSDKHGLSFYADSTIAGRLKMRGSFPTRAREELIDLDLVAYKPPLTQVLSLPTSRVQRRQEPGGVLRKLLQELP